MHNVSMNRPTVSMSGADVATRSAVRPAANDNEKKDVLPETKKTRFNRWFNNARNFAIANRLNIIRCCAAALILGGLAAIAWLAYEYTPWMSLIAAKLVMPS